MDELVGALFLFGTPIMIWFGWDWIALKITGKTPKQRARDIRVKRAQEQMLLGEVEGGIVRDAMKRHREQGR